MLGSIGYSGTPSNFVVIGKPGFHKVAADNASELASKGTHLLLVPVDVVVELCLQKVEGKLSRESFISKLEDMHGLLTREYLESVA